MPIAIVMGSMCKSGIGVSVVWLAVQMRSHFDDVGSDLSLRDVSICLPMALIDSLRSCSVDMMHLEKVVQSAIEWPEGFMMTPTLHLFADELGIDVWE